MDIRDAAFYTLKGKTSILSILVLRVVYLERIGKYHG